MAKRDDDKAEAATAAREFSMARLLTVGVLLKNAREIYDEVVANFVDPEEDLSGDARRELLEDLDANLGELAKYVQTVMAELRDVDPREGEPDLDEEEEEEDDDRREKDPEPEPTRSRRRR